MTNCRYCWFMQMDAFNNNYRNDDGEYYKKRNANDLHDDFGNLDDDGNATIDAIDPKLFVSEWSDARIRVGSNATNIVLEKQAFVRKYFRFPTVSMINAFSCGVANTCAQSGALFGQFDKLKQRLRSARKYETVDSMFDKVAVSGILSRYDWAPNRHRFQNRTAHTLALRSICYAKAGGHPVQEHSARLQSEIRTYFRMRLASFLNRAQCILIKRGPNNDQTKSSSGMIGLAGCTV